VQTTAICLHKKPLFDFALTLYRREITSPDLKSLDQSNQEVYCDAGGIAIGGGGYAPRCDQVGDPACDNIQYLEFDGRIFNGLAGGWRTSIDLASNPIMDTQSVSVTCLARNLTNCPVVTECNDRVDNDGDGHIDCADPGCHSDGNASNNTCQPLDNNEGDNTARCGDGALDAGRGEQCDDGNTISGDGC